jgi:hypothetical protein
MIAGHVLHSELINTPEQESTACWHVHVHAVQDVGSTLTCCEQTTTQRWYWQHVLLYTHIYAFKRSKDQPADAGSDLVRVVGNGQPW